MPQLSSPSSKRSSEIAPSSPTSAFYRLAELLSRPLRSLLRSPEARLIHALSEDDPSAFEAALRRAARAGRFQASAALSEAYRLSESNPFYFNRLLEAGALPDATLPNGLHEAPLLCHAAIASADLAWRVEALLRAGANSAQLDSQGRSALFFAAESANSKAMALLLAAGAPIDSLDHAGATALVRAMTPSLAQLPKNNPNAALCVRLLLSSGANPNLGRDSAGMTPVLIALDHRDKPALLALIDAGAHLESLLAPPPRHWPLTKIQRAFQQPFLELARDVARTRKERREISESLAPPPEPSTPAERRPSRSL